MYFFCAGESGAKDTPVQCCLLPVLGIGGYGGRLGSPANDICGLRVLVFRRGAQCFRSRTFDFSPAKLMPSAVRLLKLVGVATTRSRCYFSWCCRCCEIAVFFFNPACILQASHLRYASQAIASCMIAALSSTDDVFLVAE